MSEHWATCRVCADSVPSAEMIKYSIRHYAHAGCAMRRWGAAFFDRLSDWQLSRFPDAVAHDANVSAELAFARKRALAKVAP